MHENFDLEQEAAYVLGMMELYPNDKEISELVKMKGLTNSQASEVMQFIRRQGYQKRIRQARLIIFTGLLLTLVLGAAWYYVSGAGMYSAQDDIISRGYSRMLIRLLFYGAILGVLQLGFGLYRYLQYTTQLRRLLKSG